MKPMRGMAYRTFNEDLDFHNNQGRKFSANTQYQIHFKLILSFVQIVISNNFIYSKSASFSDKRIIF